MPSEKLQEFMGAYTKTQTSTGHSVSKRNDFIGDAIHFLRGTESEHDKKNTLLNPVLDANSVFEKYGNDQELIAELEFYDKIYDQARLENTVIGDNEYKHQKYTLSEIVNKLDKQFVEPIKEQIESYNQKIENNRLVVNPEDKLKAAPQTIINIMETATEKEQKTRNIFGDEIDDYLYSSTHAVAHANKSEQLEQGVEQTAVAGTTETVETTVKEQQVTAAPPSTSDTGINVTTGVDASTTETAFVGPMPVVEKTIVEESPTDFGDMFANGQGQLLQNLTAGTEMSEAQFQMLQETYKNANVKLTDSDYSVKDGVVTLTAGFKDKTINFQKALGSDVAADGVIGKQTFAAIERFELKLAINDAKAINISQSNNIDGLAQIKEELEEFKRAAEQTSGRFTLTSEFNVKEGSLDEQLVAAAQQLGKSGTKEKEVSETVVASTTGASTNKGGPHLG